MSYALLIMLYLTFILPHSIYAYKTDGSKWIVYKIINSLIALYILLILAGSVNRLFMGFSDSSLFTINDTPLLVSISFNVLYTFISLFVSVLAIKLAVRKPSARKYFIRLIPFMWAFREVDKYYFYIEKYEGKPDVLFLIISGTLLALPWLGIFIFYSLKNTKQFLNVDSRPET
jgi:hypothetical protein